MKTAGILLAAGLSRRFGPENKLLTPYRGRTLVTWAAEALLEGGCDVVAAITSSEEVAARLPAGMQNLPLSPGLPMAASFRAAIAFAQARQAGRALICLGDMPHVTPHMLKSLLARPGNTACISNGVRLPPLLLMEADYEEAARTAEGDRGARAFLQELPEEALFPLEAMAGLDVDTTEDLRP
ncbi:nucleotidyltransferase family protein [Xanthobacter sp. TB0139]|uniref:nucleotidyltransferase family protein n=1 Tax=Xanthobacter sp. TB0139 TaxID=3459178 RepID=UPI00403964D0